MTDEEVKADKKPAPEITITRFTAQDAGKLSDLIGEVWGKTPGPDYYIWQYLENPLSDTPHVYLAWDGDKLVGAIGGLIFRIRWQGTEHEGAQITDAVVLRSYQRFGVARTLYQHFKATFAKEGEVKCIMCVGNRFAKSFMNKNEESIQQIAVPPLRIRPIRSGAILAKKKLGWAAPFVDLGLKLWNAIQSMRYSGGSLEAVPDDRWPELFNADWNDSNKPLSLLKSPEWLRWRYASGTKERFSVLQMHWKDRTLLAVTRYARETGALYVADMLNVGAEASAAGALLSRVVTHAAGMGAATVQLMKLPGTPLEASLKQLLFVSRPEEEGMIMIGGYPNVPLVKEWQDQARWDFNMGDCDRL